MTNFEKSQNKRVFFDAGRHSFHLGVHIQENPYRDEPYRSQWLKGWKVAKSRFRKWHVNHYEE